MVAQRVGEVRPLLLLAERLGERLERAAVVRIELERAAQRGKRVVDAIELLGIPATKSPPPLRRHLRILGLGRDLGAFLHEIRPATGRGRELLGERHGLVVLGVDLAGRGHGLERPAQIADARLVDVRELAEQLRAIRTITGVLDPTEQHLDDVLPLARIARLALD